MYSFSVSNASSDFACLQDLCDLDISLNGLKEMSLTTKSKVSCILFFLLLLRFVIAFLFYLFILGDICFEFSALYYLASIAAFLTYCAFVFSLLSNFKIALFQHRSWVSWERHQGLLVQSKALLWGDLMWRPWLLSGDSGLLMRLPFAVLSVSRTCRCG